MKRTIILSALCSCIVFVHAQTFPVIINNTNQGQSLSCNIRSSTTNTTPYTTFNSNKRLVASSTTSGPTFTGSDGSSGSSWWRVDLPGTSSGVIGYVAAGSTYTNPVCGGRYITVVGTVVNIRPSAGNTSSFVTIGGVNARVYQGQRFASNSSTSVSGVTWYQIDLPNNCSQTSGWVAGSTGTATLVTAFTSSNNGLSTPLLSSSNYTGNSVQINWTMAIQPTGVSNTSFNLYRGINGGIQTSLTTISNLPNRYTDNSIGSSNTYTYYIVASYGNCTSSNSNTITVGSGGTGCTPVSISSHPNSQTVTAPAQAQFSITATGTSRTYQWELSSDGGNTWVPLTNSSPYSGTATNQLTVNPTAVGMSANRFRCKVSNNCTSPPVNSNAATLNVNSGAGCSSVSINSQPVSQTVTAPSQAQFSVLANGTSPNHQWELSSDGGNTWSPLTNSSPYSGVTTNQLTVNPTATGMSGNRFRCKISNNCTSPGLNSTAATLIVNSSTGCNAISILSQPTTQAVNSPAQAQFSITVNGTSPIYQWELSSDGGNTWIPLSNSSPYSGTATNQLTINPTAVGMSANRFRCKISNNCTPSISSVVSLIFGTSCAPPVISSQPSDKTVVIGGSTNFSVAASGGTTPYSYQWQVSTNGGTAWNNITAAGSNPTYANWTTATLSVSSTALSNNNYNYRCIVSSGSPCSSSSETSNSATLTVNSPPVTITLNTIAAIAPWQRAGEDYQVSVRATTSDGSGWKIIAQSNVVPVLPVESSVFQSGQTGTYNFNFSNPNSIITYSIKSVTQNAATIPIPAVNNSTTIIERKWEKENLVFYNDASQELKIPVKYIPGTSSVSFSFSRVVGRSTFVGTADNIKIAPSPLAGNTHQYIIQEHSNSNIEKVSAGLFSYTITYNGSGVSENGLFDLTKIRNLNNSKTGKTSKITVLIGGNLNIEAAIQNIGQYDSKKAPLLSWSVANDISYGYNRDVWYIATGNLNPLQKNAYNIGVALEKIRKLCMEKGISSPEISVIAHSKAGLEMRMMMDEKGAPASSPVNFTSSPANAFTNTSINNDLEAVIFLGTPHKGVDPGYETREYAPLSFITNELNAPHIKNYFSGGTRVPNGIRIGNVAAYRKCNLDDGAVDLRSSDNTFNIGAPFIKKLYVKSVPLDEKKVNALDVFSTFCDLGGCAGFLAFAAAPPLTPLAGLALPCQTACYANTIWDAFFVPFFDAKIWNNSFHHNYLTSSLVLNDPGVSCIGNNTQSTLTGIMAIIDNTLTNDCANSNPLNKVCPPAFVQNIKSVLINAKAYKKNADATYTFIGTSDENGNFELPTDGRLAFGDTIKIEAPGVETTSLSIDAYIIATGKLKVPFFKSSVSTSKIQYPSFKLVNQNPIVNTDAVQIEVKCPNAFFYQVLTSANPSFVPLSPGVSTIKLDTGKNFIYVKFIGLTDSVILSKEVYYLPDTLMNDFAYKVNVTGNINLIGTKVYAENYNNQFIKRLTSVSNSIALLRQKNYLVFERFGFRDVTVEVDSSTTFDLSALQIPYSYSSLTDSAIINFNKGLNPQHWKNISIKNSLTSSNVELSVKQYNDGFTGMSLLPQCRKFVFTNLATFGSNILLRTAIALDQVNTPDSAYVYLLTIKNGQYKKYKANVPGITEYDPEVQKLSFDSLQPDANSTHEIVLMQKQAPSLKFAQLSMRSGETKTISLDDLIVDPDSIKNDVSITINKVSNPDITTTIQNGNLVVSCKRGFVGLIPVTLTAEHDFLKTGRTYQIIVNPPDIPLNIPYLYPVPANSYINIEYILDRDMKASIHIFNYLGQLVKVINRSYENAGYYNFQIDIRNLAAGVYTVRLNEKDTNASFIKY